MTLGDDGENEEAIQVLRTAVRLKKDWVQAHNELGLALVRGKLLSDAVKEFKRAVEIDDNFAVGYYNLAETEIRLGKMKDAKKSYERLKKLGRNDLVLRLEAITGGQIAK
jgi:tetratricopeptide (TPR) repeat protein